MIDAPLALAFTAGMVASINPCGFALLPAYVAAFVAGDNSSVSGHRRVLRAVTVSVAVSVGFAITFVLVGVIFDSASGLFRQRMPWLTIAIGALMVLVGFATIAGWRPRLPLPGPAGTSNRSSLGMVGFGITYAIVSLSCTLGPFLAVTGFAMSRSALGGVVTYTVYALGMGVIILALSVSAALARDSLIVSLRSLSRYAPRIAGGLLVISGGYAVWYGRHELRVYGGDLRRDSVVDVGTNLQTQFIVFTESIGAVRIGMVVSVATLLSYAVLRVRTRRLPVTTSAMSDRNVPVNSKEQEQHT